MFFYRFSTVDWGSVIHNFWSCEGVVSLPTDVFHLPNTSHDDLGMIWGKDMDALSRFDFAVENKGSIPRSIALVGFTVENHPKPCSVDMHGFGWLYYRKSKLGLIRTASVSGMLAGFVR